MQSVLDRYPQVIKKEAHDKLHRLLDFLQKENMAFYDCEMPVLHETSQGTQRFIDVTISIKMT